MGLEDHKSLKKDFMKAARKATLVLLLAMGVTAPVFSVQAATPADFAPAPAVTSQFVSPDTLQAAAQTKTSTLNFTTIKNDDLVKKYPSLKDQVASIEQEDKGETLPTTIHIATYHDKASNSDFVFLRLDGSAFCSSQGCDLQAYVDQGNGLKSALDVMAGEKVNIITGNGKVSIVVQAPFNDAKWDLENGQFKFAAKVPLPDSGGSTPSPN